MLETVRTQNAGGNFVDLSREREGLQNARSVPVQICLSFIAGRTGILFSHAKYVEPNATASCLQKWLRGTTKSKSDTLEVPEEMFIWLGDNDRKPD